MVGGWYYAAMQLPGSRWVSFDEARMILRMSEGTLRRAIKAGTVKAERRRRNPDSPTDQREVLEVLVSDPPASVTPIEAPSASPPATEPPAAMMRLLDTVLAQAERIAALEREAGTLQGRVEAQQASIEQYIIDMLEQTERAVRAEAEVERLVARRWWKWW